MEQIANRAADVQKEQPYAADVSAAFEQYADTVYRLAFVRTCNKSDADDILSDVFLRLLKHSKKIESEAHLKAWLIRVTMNCSNSFLSLRHRRDISTELTQFGEIQQEDGFLLRSVMELPLLQKTVVYMHYYAGYSLEEIAQICSVPVGTVKSRLSRARDMLRQSLKGEDIDV